MLMQHMLNGTHTGKISSEKHDTRSHVCKTHTYNVHVHVHACKHLLLC